VSLDLAGCDHCCCVPASNGGWIIMFWAVAVLPLPPNAPIFERSCERGAQVFGAVAYARLLLVHLLLLLFFAVLAVLAV
jgi:hypothetical protein